MIRQNHPHDSRKTLYFNAVRLKDGLRRLVRSQPNEAA